MKENFPYPFDQPQIAIIEPNTLSAIGLASIIREMIPMVRTCVFTSFDMLTNADKGQFFHYFVAGRIVVEHAMYFIERSHKTIVLLEGGNANTLPSHFHTINVCLPQEELIRTLVGLHHAAHGTGHGHTEMASRQKDTAMPHSKPLLTPREELVLQEIVKGFTNKEIADHLGVEMTTVISHRKNLIGKLGLKSVSALTMYAVAHGLVKVEEI